jgi:hypothetical protein
MDLTKLVPETAAAQALPPAGSWWIWIAIAIAVLVVIALVAIAVIVIRRRKRRGGDAPALPAPAAAPAIASVMAHDGKLFRKGLPRRARRSLDDFHPVVVLGTESAAKADLIERFSGVGHRRAELGAAVARGDGYLRFALGTDELVIELAEEVCRAPRDVVEPGLRSVLGKALRRRAPLVVVAIAADSLDRQSEPRLLELGAALRSKIDALGDLAGRQLAVRVVVAETPGATRLAPLFHLLGLPDVPAVIALGDAGEELLRARLLGYGQHLGAALTGLPPAEVLDVIGFLDAAPALARALSLVTGALFADTGSEPPPLPDALYLVGASGGANPLLVPPALRRPGPSPLLRHRVVALSLAVAGAGGLAAAYHHRAAAWSQASAAAWSYDLTSDDELDLRALIRAYTRPASSGVAALMTPSFFGAGPDVVACAFVEQVRQDGLVDGLEDDLVAVAERRRPELPIYRAALLYATTDGELGRLIADRVDEWSSAVGLRPALVADYLRLAGPFRDRRWLERLREAARSPVDGELEIRLRDFLAGLGEVAGEVAGADPAALEALVASARSLRVTVEDQQRFGAVQRALATDALAPLAPSFAAHGRRFELLAELWESRAALDRVLRAVIEADAAVAERPVHTYADLVVAIGPLLVPAIGGGPETLILGETEHRVDPAAAVSALRIAAAVRVVARFLEQPLADPIDAVVPRAASVAQLLPIVTPAGVRARDRLDGRFTRGAFELWVRPTTIALAAVLDRLGERPLVRERLRQQATTHLLAYAERYEAALAEVYGSFELDLASPAAARRILRALAGPASPLRELARTVAYHAAIGADVGAPLLAPFAPIHDRFGALAPIVDESKGDPPLVAYQDILDEALVGLDAPAAPPAAGAPGPAFTPPARLTLDVLAGADKTPAGQARLWVAGAGLSPELAAPFLAPFDRLTDLGAREIEGSLDDVHHRFERSLHDAVLSRFPFAPGAEAEASLEELEAWLHPTTGRVALEVLAVLEPTFVRRTRAAGGRIVYVASQGCSEAPGCVTVPRALLDSLGRLATLADRLWDEAGKPRLLQVMVTPRPYRGDGRGGPVPELVRLTVGDDGIFYFNQRPARTALAIDWTRPHDAALALQLDASAQALAPPAIAVAASPWSLFRLLALAERRGRVHTWRVPLDERRTIAVTFEVDDPISPLFRAVRGRSTVAARGAP